MLTPSDSARLKARLLEARAEILALRRAREDSAATVKLDQSRVGRLSRMDALQQQAMAESGRRRAEETLRRIDAALRRHDAGGYGYCAQCEEPIDPRRLELDPATALCIDCAEARGR